MQNRKLLNFFWFLINHAEEINLNIKNPMMFLPEIIITMQFWV